GRLTSVARCRAAFGCVARVSAGAAGHAVARAAAHASIVRARRPRADGGAEHSAARAFAARYSAGFALPVAGRVTAEAVDTVAAPALLIAGARFAVRPRGYTGPCVTAEAQLTLAIQGATGQAASTSTLVRSASLHRFRGT